MDDTNRTRERGDPNVDDSRAEPPWTQDVTGSQRHQRAASTSDAGRNAGDPGKFGGSAWSGSNPGLTGDAPQNTADTADAGTGAVDTEDA